MQHIVIQVESIMKYPPTLSLLKMLNDLNENLYLFSSEIDEDTMAVCNNNNVKVVDLGRHYNAKDSAILKMLKIPILNRTIDKMLKKHYDDNTLIWVMTSVTLKYILNSLYEKNYIMYMYELSQEIRYYQKFIFPRVNIKRMFHGAKAVIECEYNRAFIAQAWFELETTPYILANKPYSKKIKIKQEINDVNNRMLMEKLRDKVVLIYQGIIDEERPISPFIDAVESLGDEYALVIMTNDTDKLISVKSSNTYILPFIVPPYHLDITSWADIGILMYSPVQKATTSPLNAIYCAPNKIYEYSMFGLPMIGNNIPGLYNTIEYYNFGICVKNYNMEEIKKAIIKIKDKKDIYSENSEKFYELTDNYKRLQNIISEIKNN